MKKIICIIFSMSFSVINAQTNYFINAGMMYFSPPSLTINPGDTVTWLNDGGYHDVNFNINTMTGLSFNNPVEISSQSLTSTNNDTIGSVIFNLIGNFNYDCSIYGHAASGMIGSVTVQDSVIITQSCSDLFPDNTQTLIYDCNGACVPNWWLGDGFCDNNDYMYNPNTDTYCQLNNSFGQNYCNDLENLDGFNTVDLFCISSNFDNGDCDLPGCTDGLACNYNPLAGSDDGSCYYENCSCEDYSLSIFINNNPSEGNVNLVEDCNGYCAPSGWIGDGDCDENRYMYNPQNNVTCQVFNSKADNYCYDYSNLDGFNLINLNCVNNNYDGDDCNLEINNLQKTSKRILVKIIDPLGRIVSEDSNVPIKIYIYNDGTVEKITRK
ncbi:MAG: hypothetical protein CMD07_06145 [Flavobacteriales bacterium]|nr:hypothetical protein [Flavobacteriales bacterium]